MALYISVVNHNHDEMICENSTLKDLSKEHTVILKSNTPATRELQKYCSDNNIILIQGKTNKGFGANNNEVFNYAQNHLKMNNEDYFLVLNPDIEVSLESINQLLILVKKHSCHIATINLFKNRDMIEHDNSIRHFRNIFSPLKTLFNIKRTDFYDKNLITTHTNIDWASGSFLLFKYKTYKYLGGFDERYFMYFEDMDICKRAHKESYTIKYFPTITGVHFAQHKNRNLFSIHFFYYLKSNILMFFS